MGSSTESTDYETWEATCPKCHQTANQDKYWCSNCNHQPITYVYMVTTRRDNLSNESVTGRSASHYLICRVCNKRQGAVLRCPTEGCGVDLSGLTHRTVEPFRVSLGGLAWIVAGLIGVVIVGLILWNLIAAPFMKGWNEGTQPQNHPNGEPSLELLVTSPPPPALV
jgi:hypothetical protein